MKGETTGALTGIKKEGMIGEIIKEEAMTEEIMKGATTGEIAGVVIEAAIEDLVDRKKNTVEMAENGKIDPL